MYVLGSAALSRRSTDRVRVRDREEPRSSKLKVLALAASNAIEVLSRRLEACPRSLSTELMRHALLFFDARLPNSLRLPCTSA